MRVFGLVLFLLSVVTVSSGQPELSYFDIVNHFWRYYDDSGLLGLIVFNADFTIGMYTGGQEAQWGFGDQKKLEIFDRNKALLTTFAVAKQDGFAKWRLSGLYSGSGRTTPWRYYLQQLI